MKSLKNNQLGFGAVELILIVLVICLMGAVGWLVYKNKNQEAPKPVIITKTVLAKPTNSSSKATVQSSLKIPEMSIQLVNVPASIKDMTYTVSGPNANQDYKSAIITTASLAKLNPNCSIGGLNSYNGTYESASDQFPLTSFVKQFNNFWIASIHIGVPCDENGMESFNLQAEQMQAFSNLVKTGTNLQATN